MGTPIIVNEQKWTSRGIDGVWLLSHLTLSLTALLMLLISLQSYKLAPPPKKKDDIMQIEDDSDDVTGADL